MEQPRGRDKDATQLRMPPTAGLRVGGVVLALVLVAAAAFIVAGTHTNPGLMISSLIPSVIGFGVAWVLVRACIVVGTSVEGVFLAFSPIWHRLIRLDEIAQVELLPDISPARFGGVGYRRVPGRTTALLWHGGQGVQITTADDERFIVVVPDAEVLHARITALLSAPGGSETTPSA